MSKATNKTRTANDTATREETTAITSFIATAVQTFVANAGTSNALTFAEARDYVAAVDSHAGKRGAAAAVQRAIADGLSEAGFEPLSQARYSKLLSAWRAMVGIGSDVDADAWRIVYGLVNVSSKLLSAETRDGMFAAAKRKRVDNRLPFLAAELDAARAGKRAPVADESDESDENVENDESVEIVLTPRAATADEILDALADLFADASNLTDADRIRVADAMRETAETLLSATVPADASSLTDAA